MPILTVSHLTAHFLCVKIGGVALIISGLAQSTPLLLPLWPDFVTESSLITKEFHTWHLHATFAAKAQTLEITSLTHR